MLDRKEQLILLINELTTDEQELLRLRFAAGLSFPQITAILKENQDAVKKRLYRLLDRLHIKLEDYNH